MEALGTRPGRALRACIAAAACAAPWMPGLAAPAAPSADAFASPPRISGVSVSPSNTHAAMVFQAAGQRAVAAVVALDKPGEITVVGGFPRAHVHGVQWINDDRLYYFAAEPGGVVKEGGAGVFAVDRDGGNMRQLIDWRWSNFETGTRIASRILTYGWRVVGPAKDGSPDVIVAKGQRDLDNDLLPTDLSRLDTLSLQLRRIGTDLPSGASGWLFDAKGDPQLAVAARDGRSKMFWREPGSGEWVLLADVAWHSDDGFSPLYLEDGGELVMTSARGRDQAALFTYDPRKRRLGDEPLVALDGFDVGGDIETDALTRRVVGVHVRADRPVSVWFEEKLALAQQVVDKSLPPGRFNRLLCGRCESADTFVVRSSSDRHPGEYYVYDHRKRSLVALGEARPWLDESSQGRRTFHRVPARDGLPLPVIVTHPPGADPAKPLPAVVLVHGGPWVRGGDLRWEPEAQFLATRGWRVLQVEFRGSTGFGTRHFNAGKKQWGLAMQDDLEDAVRWAVGERWVDPERVCIAGGSYGGYAALMGPVRSPGTYRCAASFAGVTSMELMFSERWNDISRQAKRHSMPELVGDPVADAEQLRRTSPVHRVADIKVPVLLAQGGLDRRVPKINADAFEAAARRAGVAVERVDFPDEGHGFNSSRNQAEYLRRLEAFLARHLGGAAD